jgi:septum formation protein
VAEILARAKAEEVSASQPAAIVIGADQILELDGVILSKPANMAEARGALLRLSGCTHRLHSAVSVAHGGTSLWSRADSAALTMRDLSPEFIGRYLAAAGQAVLGSVGAYQIEGLGIHLFSEVRGDHFTILGLPLLPLLDWLRREGAIGG